MTDERIRESLSALMDGEADELEVRRLLRSCTDAEAARLARWQLARDVLKGHAVAPVAEDFHSRLSERLEARGPSRPAWMHPLSRVAVAASVAAATVVGWQYWQGGSVPSPVTAAGETRVSRILGADAELVARGMQGVQASAAALRTPQQQDRLEALMVRHGDFAARHSSQGVMASARVVSQEASREEN